MSADPRSWVPFDARDPIVVGATAGLHAEDQRLTGSLGAVINTG